MNKAVQYFTDEYLQQCKKMSIEQILQFLDEYVHVVAAKHEKCQLISLKIEPSLLNAFKTRAHLEQIPYQTKIKQLMRDCLLKSEHLQ